MNNSFIVHTLESAPTGARLLLEKSLSDWGMIPNLHAVLAEAPEVLAAYQDLHANFSRTSLSSTERHVVWLTINVENECHYCVPAHTMMAKLDNVSDKIISAVRNRLPITDQKLEALHVFTTTVVQKRGKLSDADLENFFAAGYTKQNVLEIILGVAQKVLSNYSNHITKVPVDPPFEPFI